MKKSLIKAHNELQRGNCLRRALKFYKLLRTSKWIITNDIMNKLNCSRKTALRYIRVAEEEDWIRIERSSDPNLCGTRFYISRLF